MPTRNVVLTERQEELLAKLVDSGRYQNASEVMREGLRLIERREAEDAARVDGLRRAIDVAEQAVADGLVEDWSPALLDRIAEDAHQPPQDME